MSIDSKTATRVAARHGLGILEADALHELCDDEDEASVMAAEFAAPPEVPNEDHEVQGLLLAAARKAREGDPSSAHALLDIARFRYEAGI